MLASSCCMIESSCTAVPWYACLFLWLHLLLPFSVSFNWHCLTPSTCILIQLQLSCTTAFPLEFDTCTVQFCLVVHWSAFTSEVELLFLWFAVAIHHTRIAFEFLFKSIFLPLTTMCTWFSCTLTVHIPYHAPDIAAMPLWKYILMEF